MNVLDLTQQLAATTGADYDCRRCGACSIVSSPAIGGWCGGCVAEPAQRGERRVAALWEARELPLAMMLDSVGSGAVESLAEYVNDALCQEGLRDGARVTNRISPGYAAWDVAEQPLVFRLCPPHAIGVALNASSFMLPAKSISLLVGAGPEARVDHYFSQCARCWMRDCAYRRAPARSTVHA